MLVGLTEITGHNDLSLEVKLNHDDEAKTMPVTQKIRTWGIPGCQRGISDMCGSPETFNI